MRLLNISCKKATYLVSKKEQKRINLFDRIKLLIHLSICVLCRRFEKQSNLIIKNVTLTSADEKLSDEAKDRIIESLRNVP